jgi:hypothetical protein
MPKIDLINHSPLAVKQWKGLYSRGTDDSVPPGYFIDCLNLDFEQNEVITRPGLVEDLTQANIRRMAIYKRLNETPRYLYLTTSGDLYDSLYPSTPIVSNAAFLDFSMINYFNRAYITFHNRIAGISGVNLYVYEGSGPGTIRFAAGSPPTGFSLGVATSASAGDVEVGTHLFALAFETSSGFITKPGPDNFTVYDAPGGFAVDLSAIALGPSGTVARWILASMSTGSYDGNQFGQELFFAYRIPDNTTTTLTALSFFDADLINSADYLFDNLSLIPAGLGITSYGNRLALYGVPGFEYYVFLSKAGDPETFDETAGIILIDPSDAITSVVNLMEFRNSLYIFNKNRTYITSDNSGDPDTWEVDSVDKGIGSSVFGLSKILDYLGANTDRFFTVTHAGAYCFESGVYRKPDFSYNIKNVWDRINSAHFDLVQCVHVPDEYKVYISVPLDAATECSHLLVADYSNAFNFYGYIMPANVKWSIWNYANGSISSIVVDFVSPNVDQLKISFLSGDIYYHNDTVKTDDGLQILSWGKLFLATGIPGWIHHFNFLSLLSQGSGTITIDLYNIDGTQHVTPNGWTIATDRYLERKINFVSEKMAVKLSAVSHTGDWMRLVSLGISLKPMWMNRVQ